MDDATTKRLTKALKDFIKAVEAFLKGMDDTMKKPSTLERGQQIAQLINGLEMAKDLARHFGLGEKL